MVRHFSRGASRQAVALLAFAGLWSAAPAQAQLFPFGGQSVAPRPQHAPPPQLSVDQIRAVLAREGARLVGTPRRRGGEIFAIGRDEDGDRKRFTLDAASGEVVDVTVIARPAEPPPAPAVEPVAPGEPLPRSDHGAPELTPREAGPAEPPAAKAGRAVVVSPAEPAAAARPNPADAALSPIRPLKPAGAPRVEPLPQ